MTFRYAQLTGCLAVLMAVVAAWAAPVEFYVATNGNDTWSGRLAAPNAVKTDGPFASLERARDELRKDNGHGAVVWLRGGRYYLRQTFKLEEQDSGTAEAPITYRAYEGEKPVLVGGVRLGGFKPYKGRILQCDITAFGLNDVNFQQLFCDGQRQHIARYPNFDPDAPTFRGWAYAAGDPKPSGREHPEARRKTLVCREGDIRQWARPQDGEVFIFDCNNYWNSILPIESVDREKNTIHLAKGTSFSISRGDRYYVRNLMEELDAPGEWFLDRQAKVLYFWPPEGAADARVEVPCSWPIVVLSKAAHVVLRGLTVECSDDNGVQLTDCTDCLVASCTVRNVGGRCSSGQGAIILARGSNNGAVGCDVHDVGSNGISISGGDRETLAPAGNYADNNYIHHTGAFYKEGVAIKCYGVGHRVTHNLIHDIPRMGIRWGGSDHLFEYNHIRHVNTETCDTGAIYSWNVDWTQRGTIIRFNYLHDILGYGKVQERWVTPHYAWGVYLDDGTCGTHVYGNVIVRAPSGGVMVHGGRDNLIENNVLVDHERAEVTYSGYTSESTAVPKMTKEWEKYGHLPAYQKIPELAGFNLETGYQMAGNRFVRNIVSYTNPSAKLYSQINLPLDQTVSDFNVIWHQDQSLVPGLKGVPKEEQWNEWKKLGFEQHSLVAEPLFEDGSQDDYRLKPESPAFTLGFKPIPMDQIGPYASPLRVSWPIVEAEGVREKPLAGDEMPKPLPAHTQPVKIHRAPGTITIDGLIALDEWPAGSLEMKETPERYPIATQPCRAQICYDDTWLYVAVTVPLKDVSKLQTGDKWGRNDGAEVCVQALTPDRGPVFVVQGFVSGTLASSPSAGASEAEAKALGDTVRYAANVGQSQWSGEWALPRALLPGGRFAFNVGVRRSESLEWIVWAATGAQTYLVADAGVLELE